jgi:hypothetical protein
MLFNNEDDELSFWREIKTYIDHCKPDVPDGREQITRRELFAIVVKYSGTVPHGIQAPPKPSAMEAYNWTIEDVSRFDWTLIFGERLPTSEQLQRLNRIKKSRKKCPTVESLYNEMKNRAEEKLPQFKGEVLTMEDVTHRFSDDTLLSCDWMPL